MRFRNSCLTFPFDSKCQKDKNYVSTDNTKQRGKVLSFRHFESNGNVKKIGSSKIKMIIQKYLKELLAEEKKND